MNWRSFFSELRRRKVWRAIITYLAIAWLLIQVASILFPAFDFPEYAIKILVYILALGLIIWIGISWVYDWTKEGWQKTKALSETTEPNTGSSGSLTVFSILIAVVFVGGWFLGRIEFRPEREVMSLAVLPFDDLSGEGQQEAFVAGLQDNLISSLSQINSLRVISRTSTLRYQNTEKSMNEIAEELNVDALIESSVLKVGDSLRINIQLIQVFPKERHLWAGIFDRPVDLNLLGMFNELTQRVADEIHLKLSPEEQELLTTSKTVDPEALKAYLKGKYQLEKISPEGFQQALQLFQKALEIDPNFAPVYAELANCYIYMLQMRTISYSEALPRIYEYNNRALELDPELPEARFTMALIKWFEWDWPACEQLFDEFLATNPNHALANAFYAHLLMLLKKGEEALLYAERAITLDPMNDLILTLQAVVFLHNQMFEQAVNNVQLSYKINPRSILTLRAMEGLSFGSGDLERSIYFLEAIYSDIYQLDLQLGDVFEREGYIPALNYLCEELTENVKGQDLYIAQFYIRMDMYEETIKWMVSGFENHDVDVPYMFSGQIAQKFFNDPRVIEISKVVGIPRY